MIEKRLHRYPRARETGRAIFNVLPPALPSARLGSSGKTPDANLSGAANDFQALERLSTQAFAETAPAPQMAVQQVVERVGNGSHDEEEW